MNGSDMPPAAPATSLQDRSDLVAKIENESIKNHDRLLVDPLTIKQEAGEQNSDVSDGFADETDFIDCDDCNQQRRWSVGQLDRGRSSARRRWLRNWRNRLCRLVQIFRLRRLHRLFLEFLLP